MLSAAISLLIAFAAVRVSNGAECTPKGLAAVCAPGHAGHGHQHLNVDLAALSDSQIVDGICSAFAAGPPDCFVQFQAECPNTLMDLILQSGESLLSYGCGEGKEALLANMDCVKNEAFHDKLRACLGLFRKEDVKSDPCPVLADVVSCAKMAAKEECGSDDAANFVESAMAAQLQPEVALAGCGEK